MKKLKHIKMFEQLSSTISSDFTVDQIKNMTEEEFFTNCDSYLKAGDADQLETLIKIWASAHKDIVKHSKFTEKLSPYVDFLETKKDYKVHDMMAKSIEDERFRANRANEMYRLPIDMGHDNEPVGDWLENMNRILKKYNLTIIGFKPIGPSGGNMEITFRGKYSDIELMVSTEMPNADLEEIMQHAGSD